MRISALIVRHGSYVDAICPVYADVSHTLSLPSHGGDGGSQSIFVLGPDEYINRIGGLTGSFLNYLVVETNTGRSQEFGIWGAWLDQFSFPQVGESGREVFAFFGRAGSFVDQIGFYLR
jgi:hypothetical protein